MECHPLDLASFSSVRSFAKRVKGTPVSAVIHNAGVMAPPYSTTADGHELTFQVRARAFFACVSSSKRQVAGVWFLVVVLGAGLSCWYLVPFPLSRCCWCLRSSLMVIRPARDASFFFGLLARRSIFAREATRPGVGCANPADGFRE